MQKQMSSISLEIAPCSMSSRVSGAPTLDMEDGTAFSCPGVMKPCSLLEKSSPVGTPDVQVMHVLDVVFGHLVSGSFED